MMMWLLDPVYLVGEMQAAFKIVKTKWDMWYLLIQYGDRYGTKYSTEEVCGMDNQDYTFNSNV